MLRDLGDQLIALLVSQRKKIFALRGKAVCRRAPRCLARELLWCYPHGSGNGCTRMPGLLSGRDLDANAEVCGGGGCWPLSCAAPIVLANPGSMPVRSTVTVAAAGRVAHSPQDVAIFLYSSLCPMGNEDCDREGAWDLEPGRPGSGSDL